MPAIAAARRLLGRLSRLRAPGGTSAFLAVALVGLLGLAGCAASGADAGKAADDRVHLRGVALTEYDQAKRLWALQASDVTYEEGGQALLDGIHAQFWEGNRLASHAVSPRAVMDTRSRDVQMQGGIAVTSALASTSVTASTVAWQADHQELHATGEVTFMRGPNRFHCQALTANRSLRHVHMDGPILATLQVSVP